MRCALCKLVLGAFGRLLELVPQALEDADEGCKPRSLLRPVHHRARPLAPPQQPAQVDARVLHFHGFRASYRSRKRSGLGWAPGGERLTLTVSQP